ncbi:hypothetical protein OCU04_004305 [Sclerotinia nivalis]|uniref:Uncharacterized protein n=1 Tax=Sclerotinia nivalis TaxID=352851 RepID=A0A9X0AQ64_9HELO|nr:hypothetical protein OCU04_004305 [Sclerotinia nivalis]
MFKPVDRPFHRNFNPSSKILHHGLIAIAPSCSNFTCKPTADPRSHPSPFSFNPNFNATNSYNPHHAFTSISFDESQALFRLFSFSNSFKQHHPINYPIRSLLTIYKIFTRNLTPILHMHLPINH